MKRLLLTLIIMVATLSGKAQMCIPFSSQTSNPLEEPNDQVEPGYLLGEDCGSVFVRVKYHILTDGSSSTFFADQKARLTLGIHKATQTFLEHALNLALNDQLNQATTLVEDLPLYYPIAETESMDLEVLEALLAFVSAAVVDEQQYFLLDENNEHALEVVRNYYNEQLEDKSSYPAVLLGNLMCLLDDNCSDFYPVLGNGQMQLRKAGPKALTQRVPAHADFKLYPNPATSFTSLAYQTNSSSKSFSLGIYNTQGQIVQSMELTKSRDEIVIDTDQLVPGLYLVQLRDENGQIIGSGKLVKK